jgi:hypothetical protein
MQFKGIEPKGLGTDQNKNIQLLYDAYFQLKEELEYLFRNISNDNIKGLKASKLTAGTIEALIKIISPVIETGELIGGTITGNTISASDMNSTNITASNIESTDISASNISGGTIDGTVITGGTIIGTTIKTAESPDERIEITGNQFLCYNDENKLQGLAISEDASNFGDIDFYIDGTKAFSIYNGESYTALRPRTGYRLVVGSDDEVTTIRNTTSLALKTQSEAPGEETDILKIYYDGTNLKTRLPDGTIKTITMT